MKYPIRLLVSYVIMYEDHSEFYVFNEIIPYSGGITEQKVPTIDVMASMRASILEEIPTAVSIEILSLRFMASNTRVK